VPEHDHSEHHDLVELSDFGWRRLRERMSGLTDDEYRWEPVPGCRTVRPVADGTYRSDGPAEPGDPRVFTTLAWRLCHIVDFLREDRNGPWLGQAAAPRPDRTGDPGTAAEVLAALDEAYGIWRGVLVGVTEESLRQPIGRIGGWYAKSTRRSFVLHILDELIHHGAEAALLRDLYAASRP
jgi:DinB superfamily